MLATSYGIPERFTCAVCRQSTGKPDVAENGLRAPPDLSTLQFQAGDWSKKKIQLSLPI